MSLPSHATVLLTFEEAFREAGERGARLAAQRAAELGLAVPYSDGKNLVELLPDGTIRAVKPLEARLSGMDLAEEGSWLLTSGFDPAEFES